MYLKGDDPNSSYYVGDYLAAHNITVWVNNESHSHSMAQDLNLDSVMYHNADVPGLNLMHVSRYGFLEDTFGWQEEFAPVTQAELGDRQRIYAANSDVLIWHDYTWRFMYVNDTINGTSTHYARESESSMGYPYELITPEYQQADGVGANVYPNGTWYLKPFVEEYFAAMKQEYNVWYATPDEVYDRSLVTSKLIVSEDSAWVNITNPTTSDISGLTLFTKEHPSYSLANGNTTYLVHKGAENYQFVIPQVPAGGSISLAKVKSTSSATMVKIGSTPFAILAYMNELNLRTIRDGDGALLSNTPIKDEQSTTEIGDGRENTIAIPVQLRNQIEA
jgi:hypothetical protein